MFSEPVIPESSHMDHKIVAGIVFVFVLFVIIEVVYACIGSRIPLTRFIEVTDQICTASATVMQIISSLRIYRFFEKAADAIVDANDVHASSTHTQNGGTGNLSTISRPSPVQVA